MPRCVQIFSIVICSSSLFHGMAHGQSSCEQRTQTIRVFGRSITVKVPPAAPAQNDRISQEKKDFAQGDFEVIIARGGSTGVILWAHLHGRHKGRTGSSKYTVAPLVRDNTNYYYYASDVQTLTIGSDPLKSSVDKHKIFCVELAGEALEAHQNGIKLIGEPTGDRHRASLGDELGGAFSNYLNGAISRDALLKKLNAGKRRPF